MRIVLKISGEALKGENNISDLIYCNMVESKKCKNCENNKCSLIQWLFTNY